MSLEMRSIQSKQAGRFGRRGFLAAVGAGGLTVAGAVFTSQQPQDAASAFCDVKTEAASCGCCGLVYCPPTTSLSHCDSVSHYQWECTESGGFLYCNCCEVKSGSGYSASAYQCQYP